ncbi:hypothetical protein L9F34_000316 [Klebsiella aerogenes]|uniref:hypothetical protein n=1 Tax=Klebsiella TaxID=570 RepID=UPI000F7D64F1|nr:hypothetical protein [Klebsiella aerogenes]EKV3390536.1 hypothetical protein [Klebsiella aerogenes]EMF0745999.1 hypothetical protein [Klebsiella aerogenes]KAE9484465.1 hypothetical protein F8B42_00254 [Klebsiella aerogenes]MEB6079534.1 hypothetical protein [Klebsiella aerogenes]RSW53139.1 hypothetical protein EGH44_06205 [Klebsiella aerogenes]
MHIIYMLFAAQTLLIIFLYRELRYSIVRLSNSLDYERKTLDMIADHIPETKKKVAEIERHTTSKFIKDLASDMAFKDLQRANAYWYEKAVELGYKEEE